MTKLNPEQLAGRRAADHHRREANAAAGLDDTTSLVLADYSVLPGEGQAPGITIPAS
jgi:hypothetical protein